jgi:hypothetical protein
VNDAATDDPPPSDLERRAREDLPHSARSFGRWVRARLVEHWYGLHYWRELDRNDFGVLRRIIHPNHGLVTDVVALVLTGNENLTIITWALETDRPLDDVVAILTVLDVNARRLRPFPSLIAAAPPCLRVLLPRPRP